MRNKLLLLTKKWWFYLIIILANLTIPPIATSNFKLESWSSIVQSTLINAFCVQSWKPYSVYFQLFFIAIIVALFIFHKNSLYRKLFSFFVTFCYLLFAIGQNIAITENYGLSVVTINVIMFLFVAYGWLNEFKNQKNKYDFKNWNIKYLWLIIFSIIAFWHPINYSEIPSIDLNPSYFIIGGSSMAFCLTTPLFLTILTLNIPSINILTYRITALIGTVIGFYNMLFFIVPELFWVAVVHIPLISVSLFCLIYSYRIEKRYKLAS